MGRLPANLSLRVFTQSGPLADMDSALSNIGFHPMWDSADADAIPSVACQWRAVPRSYAPGTMSGVLRYCAASKSARHCMDTCDGGCLAG